MRTELDNHDYDTADALRKVVARAMDAADERAEERRERRRMWAAVILLLVTLAIFAIWRGF